MLGQDDPVPPTRRTPDFSSSGISAIPGVGEGACPPWLRYWKAGAKKSFREAHGERRTRDAEGVEGLLCKLTVTVKAK